MSSVEAAIYTILSSNISVSILAGTRIFPLTRGNCTTFPAVSYQRISTRPLLTHDDTDGLDTVRFQINSYGKSFSQAMSMAGAVRSALSGWNSWVGEVYVTALFDNERQLFENETGIYGISQDFMIKHRS